jgi:hypothetical protein
MIVSPATDRRGLGLGQAAMAWTVARLCVAVGYFAADGIADVLHLHGGASLHVRQALVTWDGDWYWQIARHGYGAVPHEGLRFFPLYPMLARALAWPIGDHVAVALIVITNLAAFAALVLVRRVVLEETGDEALARRSMWLMAVFPAAGALVFAYAEALMLAVSLVAFLAIRRQKWWIVAICGLVCGLTRPAGAFLVVPFALEALSTRQRSSSLLARLAAVASPGVGVALYLFWVGGQYGDWLAPIKIQRQLRAGFQDPITRLYDGVRHLSQSRLDAPNLAFAVVFIALVVVAARTQRASWSVYALVTLIVALSAHNIDSIGRYGLVAFPFVVAIARLGDDERLAWAAIALSAAALVGLTVMQTLGAYQP